MSHDRGAAAFQFGRNKKKPNKKNAYFSPQVLIGYYNHVGWVPDSCGSPSDIGEDYFCNQDMPGVQIKHLAQPANQTEAKKKTFSLDKVVSGGQKQIQD